LEEARRVAESEGVALNQLINVALGEKLSALRWGLLSQAGQPQEYLEGEADFEARGARTKSSRLVHPSACGACFSMPLPAWAGSLALRLWRRTEVRRCAL